MNSSLIQKVVGSAALLGAALSASAQLPTGSAPPLASLPAGLNPAIAVNTYASPNGGLPITAAQELFASGGPVYVTDLGPTGASFDEQIFVASPADGVNNLFLDNHSTANGTTYYLGTFAAGTEIEFGLDMLATGSTVEPAGTIVYDGPGSRNPDGDVHAYMVNGFEGLPDTTYVGFEDELADVPSDWNYVDEIYAFTGTKSASAPDMPATLPLLALGLSGLAAFGRRFRK